MGCPVIATDIRGCRQVVDDGVTGRLVPVHDVGALVDAIDTIASDQPSRVAMGRAAIAKATTSFDQQRIIEHTLATYRRLLSAKGLPGVAPRGSSAHVMAEQS